MKSRLTNRIDDGAPLRRKILLAVIALAAVAIGGKLAWDALAEICNERSLLFDCSRQVVIEAGKMVRAEVIAEHFGLRKGANLAAIDFSAKRRELLAKVPTLKAVTIQRIEPDSIRITAEERTPIARLNLRGNRRVSGRVVDDEGVVFMCQRGTQMLPTIREASAPGAQSGQTLEGASAQALELVNLCRESEYLELGVLEVDVSKPDYLVVTLGNYSKVKIRWTSHDDLARRLNSLLTAIRSRIGDGAKIWNATMPDRIFADTQERP